MDDSISFLLDSSRFTYQIVYLFLGYYARIVGRPVRSIPYSAAWALALADELKAILTRRPPRVRRIALGYVVEPRALFHRESPGVTRVVAAAVHR
jgi:hypothetical protein